MSAGLKITVLEELDHMTLPLLQMRMGDVAIFAQVKRGEGTELEIARLGGISHEQAVELLRNAGLTPVTS